MTTHDSHLIGLKAMDDRVKGNDKKSWIEDDDA